MPIHDLGYRSWDGTPSPHVMRWAVIAQTGIKLAWRSSWLRRLLLLSWLPVVGMGVMLFGYETWVTDPFERQRVVSALERSPFGAGLDIDLSDEAAATHALWSWALLTLFRYPQLVAMLFVVGLISPTLIARDMQSRAFLLYFSRPIERADYLLGKSMVVWFFLAMITTLPALALYALAVSLSPDLSVIKYTWDLPFRILGASLWLVLPTTAIALCLSSMTTESRYAAFAWIALWVLGVVAYGILAPLSAGLAFERDANRRNYQQQWQRGESTSRPPGIRVSRGMDPQTHNPQPLGPEEFEEALAKGFDTQWSLLSLYHTLGRVQAWIFGMEKNFSQVMPSIVLLILVTGGTTTLLIQRISSPMRV